MFFVAKKVFTHISNAGLDWKTPFKALPKVMIACSALYCIVLSSQYKPLHCTVQYWHCNIDLCTVLLFTVLYCHCNINLCTVSVLLWEEGYTFPYCPVDEAIRVRIDPVENSVVAALGNRHGQESNTRRVKFQYYPIY